MLYTKTASCWGSAGLSTTRLLDFDLERSVRERLRLRRDCEREDLDRVLRLLFSSPSSFIRSYSPFLVRDRLRLRRDDPERLFSEDRFFSFSESTRRMMALKNRIERPNATTIESNLRIFFAISSGVFPKTLLAPCFDDDDDDDDECIVLGSIASSTHPAWALQ